ncbi:MAG TPA: hypothetical protein VG148_00340 [Pyrinomonadaceae bacterium]|nr:hypothetical protein [Pyrinomonadaceae bacterium]
MSSRRRGLLVFALAAGLLAADGSAQAAPSRQGAAAGQKAGAKGQKNQPAAQAKDARPWSVRMSKDAPHTFTVKAKEASLSEITGEFSKLLKVPVTLSPLLARQRVTLDFGGMNLEGALRLLAPQAYVDYVAGGGEPQPRPLAIYLQGMNEKPPALTATVRGGSEAILFEGDTEEGLDETDAERKEKEEQLRVTFAQNQLSVRARKQPLTVVLFRIASEVGVPLDLRWESRDVIDVEFDNYSIEQAVRTLSPGALLYYRMDLQSFHAQPLRLALVSPTAAVSPAQPTQP